MIITCILSIMMDKIFSIQNTMSSVFQSPNRKFFLELFCTVWNLNALNTAKLYLKPQNLSPFTVFKFKLCKIMHIVGKVGNTLKHSLIRQPFPLLLWAKPFCFFYHFLSCMFVYYVLFHFTFKRIAFFANLDVIHIDRSRFGTSKFFIVPTV